MNTLVKTKLGDMLDDIPNLAQIILIDDKKNVLFATHHGENSRIWWPDGSMGVLGRLAHKTKVLALKSEDKWISKDKDAWDILVDAKTPDKNLSEASPVSRVSRMMKAQQVAINAKKVPDIAAESVPAAVLVEPQDDFVPLHNFVSRNRKNQHSEGMFVTVRSNGKYIFSREMRTILTEFDIELSPSTQKIRVVPSRVCYKMNKSGCFCSKGALEILKFDEGEMGRRVYLELAADGNYYGDFKTSKSTYRG